MIYGRSFSSALYLNAFYKHVRRTRAVGVPRKRDKRFYVARTRTEIRILPNYGLRNEPVTTVVFGNVFDAYDLLTILCRSIFNDLEKAPSPSAIS